MGFKVYIQYDSSDCGATCLRMIARYYGKKMSQHFFHSRISTTRSGTSLLHICEQADIIGLENTALLMDYEELCHEAKFPCIVHWKKTHFVVVVKIDGNKVHVADPAFGLIVYEDNEFLENWISVTNEHGISQGIVLLLEPNSIFYMLKDDAGKGNSFKFIFNYLFRYKKVIAHLFFSLLVSSLILLIIPFLSQAIVDIGVNEKNVNFIYIILLSQLALLAGRTTLDFIRRRFLLHMSAKVNLSLMSDFFKKLMELSMDFFNVKHMGDLIQRMEDHDRIQRFITTQTLNFVFVVFNVIIFGVVLYWYSIYVFVVFLLGSVLYCVWISLFLKKRRTIDYKLFDQKARNKNKILQLLYGMEEIKLQGCKNQKRREWEQIQMSLFKVNLSSLSLQQTQEAGSIFINEVKNILIILITAILVIRGELTLGMMMAIQFIIGQLNVPIMQIMDFILDYQDIKISLERVNEIHSLPEENKGRAETITTSDSSIYISDLTFQYNTLLDDKALNNISFIIPQNKITAIVGASGSGKTTLIKLLLGYYKPTSGSISIGDKNINNIDLDTWRRQCGVVMQSSYIFSDTIAKNIAISEKEIDFDKLNNAATLANINEFVKSLPIAYDTLIGTDGQDLSQGQKQRILISRIVYKNAKYIFLDEATNSLDAENEKVITNNLNDFYKEKTVVIVAHRLSTVKNADQIIVLDNGEITEMGTHWELIEKKGKYYRLVKDQLELGE